MRRKKSKTTIFDCLEITKPEKEIKSAPAPQIRNCDKPRPLRRFESVTRRWKMGKKMTSRQIRRFVRLGAQLNLEVPQAVKDAYQDILKGLPKGFLWTNPKPSKRKRKPIRYDAYIKSALWEKRKNLYYQKYGRRCVICGSVNRVELHHRLYGHYGEEKDEDLVPFCNRHHLEFHEQHRTKKNMKKETMAFIIFNQAVNEADK